MLHGRDESGRDRDLRFTIILWRILNRPGARLTARRAGQGLARHQRDAERDQSCGNALLYELAA
jgi:hypothetical protein